MRIERIILIFGFTILMVTVSMLYILSGIESLQSHPVIVIVKLIMFIGFIYEVFLDAKSSYHQPLLKRYYWNIESVYEVAALITGSIVTYFISIEIGHGGVIASAIVGMTAVIIFPYYAAAAAYCGSFVGMASTILFSSYEELLLAGVFSSMIFIMVKPVCKGFGGKLGTIAFAGSLYSITILGSPVITHTIPSLEIGISLVVYSVTGAYLTYLINVILGHGPVIASALVGLLAGLLLPVIHGTSDGSTMALMVFCASFTGMSSRERIRSSYLIMLAGALTALLFIYSMPHLGGAGGKLGTIAFGAVIAVSGIDKLVRRGIQKAR